jgi:hypothetical protein
MSEKMHIGCIKSEYATFLAPQQQIIVSKFCVGEGNVLTLKKINIEEKLTD